MKFQDFQFHSDVAEGARAAGYSIPTPIQQQAVPVVMQGRLCPADPAPSRKRTTGKGARADHCPHQGTC